MSSTNRLDRATWRTAIVRVTLVLWIACRWTAGAEDLNALPTVPSGYRIEFVAREPLIHNPCAMAFDAKGRLCLAMGPQYRKPTPKTPGDSIYLLMDRDHDGVYDAKKEFATGFNSIQSIAWRGNDLWIANAPDLTVVRDTNGDDVADEYVLIYTDLGNLEHGLHGLNWAPDGRLYMSKGNSKGLNREDHYAPLPFRELWGVPKPQGAVDFPPPKRFSAKDYRHAYHDPADDWGREGGVLVCDELGKNLEIVSRGFRNPWDIAYDDEFDWQGTDNDQDQGDRVFTPFYGSHYGWGHPWSAHWTGRDHPPSAPITGPVFHGSGTGMVFYNAGQFPPSNQRVWFFNDWFRRITYMYRAEWQDGLKQPVGGKWTPFVTQGASLFKPTDIEVAPDGSLLILGWGREYGVQWNDKMEQVNEGRIFRVSFQSGKLRPSDGQRALSRLPQRSIDELIADFGQPIPAWRTNAQRQLLRRGPKIVPELLQALRSKPPVSRAQETWILWTLGQLPKSNSKGEDHFHQWALKGSSNRRVQSLRILAFRARRGAKMPVVPIQAALRDSDARIRMEAVQAIRRSLEPLSEGVRKAHPLAREIVAHAGREKSRVVFYATWQALRVVIPAKQRKQMLTHSDPRVRLAALLSLAEDRDLDDPTTKSLVVDEDEQVRHIAALWFSKRKGSSLLTVLPRDSEFRDVVFVRGESGMKPADIRYTTDGSKPTIASARLRGNVKLSKSTVFTAALFVNNKQAGPVVVRKFERMGVAEIQSRSGILSARAKSGRAYQIVDGGAEVGKRAYTDRGYTFRSIPPDLAGAILLRTANDDSGSKGKAFLEISTVIPVTLSLGYDTRAQQPRWLSLDKSFRKTGEIIETTDARFEIFERKYPAGKIELGGNAVDGRDGGKSNYIVVLRPQGLPQLKTPTTLSKALAAVASADAERGKALFFASGGAGCVKCHSTKAGSNDGFGPNLAALSKQGDPKHIVKSILDPDAEIKEGYSLQMIVNTEGQVIQGLLKEETASHLTIAQIDGTRTVIARQDIEERVRRKVSPMPSFARMLNDQQIADIVAWLQSNRKRNQ